MGEALDQNRNSISSPKVCIIGAGFSGMCAAIRLKKDLDFDDYEIIDIHKEIGGTWLTSTYPGAGCDVPIHAYSYTFERRPNWSAQYAGQEEILKYLREVATKYDINSKTRFQHFIQKLVWNQELLQWTATIEDLRQGIVFQRNYDIVINATGFLRVPKVPEEFQNFEGKILHTAAWDHSVNVKDKIVAVIGVGASGVQVVPPLSKVAKKLYVFQRTPSWVFPKPNCKFGPVSRWLFEKIPLLLWFYQKLLFFILEGMFKIMERGSWVSKIAKGIANRSRRRQLKYNTDLYEKLTPKYDIGCKRICISSKFYPCFTQENTHLVTSKIQNVTKDSIISRNDGEIKIEILVLATGYRVTDYFFPMDIIDKDGKILKDKWKAETPSLYLGITGHNIPNHFILYGPNTSTGHNSVVLTVEIQMDWIVNAIREMQNQNASVVSMKKETEDTYMSDIREKFDSMVWSASSCYPWYTDELGRNIAMYPGNLKSFRKRVNTFDYKNLDFICKNSDPKVPATKGSSYIKDTKVFQASQTYEFDVV